MDVPVIAALIGGLLAVFLGHPFLTWLQIKKDIHLGLMQDKRRVYSDVCAKFAATMFEQVGVFGMIGPDLLEEVPFRAWRPKNIELLVSLEATLNSAMFYAEEELETALYQMSEKIHFLINGSIAVYVPRESQRTKEEPVTPFTVLNDLSVNWEQIKILMRKEIGIEKKDFGDL
jgi:hypothetical protein